VRRSKDEIAKERTVENYNAAVEAEEAVDHFSPKQIYRTVDVSTQPGGKPIENDWANNGQTDPRAENFRWNGISTRGKKEPLSPEVLGAVGEAARQLGRALNEKECAEIIERARK
jgi:hypothetical protein